MIDPHTLELIEGHGELARPCSDTRPQRLAVPISVSSQSSNGLTRSE